MDRLFIAGIMFLIGYKFGTMTPEQRQQAMQTALTEGEVALGKVIPAATAIPQSTGIATPQSQTMQQSVDNAVYYR